MRGRRPDILAIATDDQPLLEQIAHRRHLPWFQVQRARIVLAIASGQRTETLASHMDCDRTTIRRICRRYEQFGLEGLLAETLRGGRLPQISPPPAGPDRPTGLPGADRPGSAHHALDQRRSGPPSRGRRARASHQ